MFTSPASSNVFLNLKNKKRKHMENQKAKLQNRKKTGSKIIGEKMERQKGGKKRKNWTCPFAFLLFFFAFSICFFVLLFCFYFVFFCFLPGKKQNKKQTKSKSRKQTKKQKKCKWTSPFFSFFPLFVFPFSPFFSLLFCFCVFLDFADLLFGFSIFFGFFAFFSSFKKIRISGGLVNLKVNQL